MTTSIRRRLFSPESLEQYWERHRREFRASPSAGSDGRTFKDFEARFDAEVCALSAEIASATYKQLPLKASFIRKDATRFRCINVPAIRDRLVQRVLLEHVRERYCDSLSEFPAFGVMRGQGPTLAIQYALRCASRTKWVTRLDIASFFDRVPRELAAKRVLGAFSAPSLAELLLQPVNAETQLTSPEQRQQFRDCGLTAGIGLRQGQPLSPLFAYVYLKPLDAYARRRRWSYVRYVDDVLIFSDSRADAGFRLSECRQVLQGLSIELSSRPEKTFVRSTHERFKFLGIDFLRRKEGDSAMLLPRGLIEGIKRDLSDKVDSLLSQRRPGAFIHLCRHLADMRNSYRPAYGQCEDWASLERELPALSKGMMRRALEVIAAGLGRDGNKNIEKAAFWALGIARPLS